MDQLTHTAPRDQLTHTAPRVAARDRVKPIGIGYRARVKPISCISP